MKTNRISIALAAVAVPFALVGCHENPLPVDPNAAYGVYLETPDGEQFSIGYFEPGPSVLTQITPDWDFHGYWFEAGEATFEVLGQVEVSEVAPLEVGAVFDANVWLDDPGAADAVPHGVIVVDNVPTYIPADIGGLEAAAIRCKSTVKRKTVYDSNDHPSCMECRKTICENTSTGKKSGHTTCKTVGIWKCF